MNAEIEDEFGSLSPRQGREVIDVMVNTEGLKAQESLAGFLESDYPLGNSEAWMKLR